MALVMQPTRSFILNPSPEKMTVMKSYRFAVAALAALILISCQREQSFEGMTPVDKDAIAFSIGNATTRSSCSFSGVSPRTGVSISIGKTDKGEPLYLEETIEELNPAPATKGSPVYTQNLGTLYPTLGVYATGTVNGDAVFSRMDENMSDNKEPSLGQGWRYQHVYPGDQPWPDDETKVDFYLRIPQTGTGITATPESANHCTTFSLSSPKSGADQQDLLFAHTSINKTEHNGFLPYGAPVLMYHTLSAVKFRNGHPNSNATKTVITRVELSGIKGSGDCSVSFDDNGVATVSWSNLSNSSTEAAPFYLDFSNPTYTSANGANNSDGTVSEWNSGLTGTTWTNAAADHNLNDEDGSLTFWFIPQQLTGSAKLKLTFLVKTPFVPEGTEITHTVDFGDGTRPQNTNGTFGDYPTWKAGQLRTYTLMPYDVDVEIDDTIQGLIKSNLKVENTGNVPEYVRLLLLGNWYGWETEAEWNAWKNAATPEEKDEHAPDIIVGYTTDGSDGQNVMVDPWFRGGYDHDGDGVYEDPYGYFDPSFALGSPQAGNKWIDASGGFYYPEPIGPGTSIDSGTDLLFQSYTVSHIPDIYIAVPTSNVRVKAKGVHLVLTVSVQAIGALDKQGNEKGWLEAWYEATGNPKLDPADPRNAEYVHTASGSGE